MTAKEVLEQVSGLSIEFIKEHHDVIPLEEYLDAMERYAKQKAWEVFIFGMDTDAVEENKENFESWWEANKI